MNIITCNKTESNQCENSNNNTVENNSIDGNENVKTGIANNEYGNLLKEQNLPKKNRRGRKRKHKVEEFNDDSFSNIKTCQVIVLWSIFPINLKVIIEFQQMNCYQI